MPYETCPRCGLRTYYVSGEECPRCGTPLGDTRRAARQPNWRPDTEPRGAVERVLAVARRELKMDTALLSEVRDGREIVLWATGNGRIPAFVPGGAGPPRGPSCPPMLGGGGGNNLPHPAAAPPRPRPPGGQGHGGGPPPPVPVAAGAPA